MGYQALRLRKNLKINPELKFRLIRIKSGQSTYELVCVGLIFELGQYGAGHEQHSHTWSIAKGRPGKQYQSGI